MNPFVPSSEVAYTHLFARISEEDDGGYTVHVKLHDNGKTENVAWGDEIADSFETASKLVATLADRYSIGLARIKIDIRMQKVSRGTRH